jgi:hypothetical protein
MLRLSVAVLAPPVLMLLVACVGPGGSKDETRPDPPGQLVDLGGRRLHATLAGAGATTVVIENGAGAFSVDWAHRAKPGKSS